MMRGFAAIGALWIAAACGRANFDPLPGNGPIGLPTPDGTRDPTGDGGPGDGAGVLPDGGGIDSAIDAPEMLPSSLILWLRMDDGIADRISADSSSAGNDTPCVAGENCPTEVTGHTGLALNGWSATNRLELVDAAQWRLTTFTFAAWIRVTAIGGASAVLSKPLGGSTDNSFQFDVRNGGEIACSANDGGNLQRVTAPASLALNTWTHVACTYDGSNLYVFEGGAQTAGPVPSAPPGYDAQSIWVGGDENNGAAAASFDGEIDELRVYNVVLSAGEIAALAQ